MKKIFTLTFGLIVCISGRSQTADSYNADVLNDYFALQLDMITVTPGFTPPVASRALGYTGLGAYEACVHGMPDMNSFSGVLPQLNALPVPIEGQSYHWGIVTNHTLYALCAAMYNNASVAHLDDLVSLRDNFDDSFSVGTDAGVVSASIEFGDDLATAIISYADTDGALDCQFNNFPNDYIPPTGPGLWMPLSGQSALQPYWGEKRCFIQEYLNDDFFAPSPPEFSVAPESDLYLEAQAVYDAVNNVTEDQNNIAHYWGDGGGSYTPPGHSISMLRFIMIEEEENLAFAARAYARLGMALSDAFVACWKTKYEYNLLRPVHYIQDNIDAEWNTLLDTPPFPEYVSGHSTQSGAFGAVMTALYGDNYAFTDSTYGELHGGPRYFENFVACAEETALSRLYGGIHYPVGNNEGSTLGIMIGEMVNELFDSAVTGIDEQVSNLEFQVYPNPTQGVVQLKSSLTAYQVMVLDLTGKELLTYDYRTILDLSSLTSGFYLLQVKDYNQQTIGISRVLLQ